MMKAYQEKTDMFFYNNYSNAWKGASLEDMLPIYAAEMRDLLRCFAQGMPYHQEFAKDYRLAQQLRVEVDGIMQPVQKPDNFYHIVPAKGVVLFQKESEICYQCSYRKFFQILSFYIQQLQERFLMQEAKQWQAQLDVLKKGRFHTQLEKLTDKLRFWDHSPGNPDTHFEGAKKLDLYPGDIASFRQLRCQDTLRSLTVNGLFQAKDIEVLSEYTQLKTLYLRQMRIEDIHFLSTLVNLDELGLPGNQITDLSPLANLKKLTHLYIVDNPITDFSVLAQMPKLRTLYTDIDQLPDQLAWDKIPPSIALRVMYLTPLENCLYHVDMVYSRDISCLVEKAGGKQKLVDNPKDQTRLEIKDRWLYSGITQALGYPPMVKYDLSKMKTLDCSDSITLSDDCSFLTEIGDYSCLVAAMKLKELNLSGRVVKDFSWLRKCTNIRVLNVSYTDFSDLSLLSGMKQLTTLIVAGCKNLQEDSFCQFQYMKNLKTLDASYTSFHDLHLLQGLDKLQDLYLKQCNTLVGIEDMIQSCKNLKTLDLSGTNFRDLRMLKGCNKLQDLYLNQCENLMGMEDMVEDLIHFRSCVLTVQEQSHFYYAIVKRFCEKIEGRFQWKENTESILETNNCADHNPFFKFFLMHVDSCISVDRNTWLLTESDYHLHPEISYPWEQKEGITNKADTVQNQYGTAQQVGEEVDEPFENTILSDIWAGDLLPLFVSIRNDGVWYYAIDCWSEKIVFWKDIAQVQETKQTLPQFLLQNEIFTSTHF